MYKITLIKSSRTLQIFSKSPKVTYWSIIPITSHLFEWAVGAKIRKRFDRLPFQVCPRFFIISHYAKNVKRSFVCKSPRKHHPNNTYQKREHASRSALFFFSKGNTAQNHVDFPRIPRRITPPEMSVWSPCPAPVRCWRKSWHGGELPRAWR